MEGGHSADLRLPYIFPSSEVVDADYHIKDAVAPISSSTSRKNKSFLCPEGKCQKIFTTKFRLQSLCLSFIHNGNTSLCMGLLAHVNRFHTESELQQRYHCQQCCYKTVYKTDLTRHRRSAHPSHSGTCCCLWVVIFRFN